MGEATGAQTFQIDVATSLEGIDAAQWNALVGENDPFLEHEFLYLLERCGVVGEDTSWQCHYLTARDAGSRLVGAIPFYAKWDSYGEYIFDWAWADAYHRAGIAYYPKLVVAAPFTPANGERILVAGDVEFEPCAAAMVDRLDEFARAGGYSGIHFLFGTERETDFLGGRGYLPRITYQFHWYNRAYESFDDFLADLRASKRKQIRKERARLGDMDIVTRIVEGDDIRPEHLSALWRFYRNTTSRKWGEAYLNEQCFEAMAVDFRHRLVLVLAELDGELIAGTLNARKNANLYGRYWGTAGHWPGLHFECCYYRLIEYAIEHGISRFEAGAQGEHKFLRGFATKPTLSAHWLADPGGRSAIGRYLEQEREQTLATIDHYNSRSPLKYVRGSEL